MLTRQLSGSGMRMVLAAAMALALAQVGFAESVALSSLQVSNQPSANAKVNTAAGGGALTIGGKKYETGLGVQAPSKIVIDLKRGVERFKATVGVDDETSAGGAMVTVSGDDRQLWPTGAAGGPRGGGRGRGPNVSAGAEAQQIDVDVKGIRVLVLEVAAGGGGARRGAAGGGAAPAAAHIDWADASLVLPDGSASKPEIPVLPKEEYTILTPKSAETPRINSTKLFGVRPGHPFLFTVAATGQRPIQFSADGLPAGLTIDPATGFMSGSTQTRGEYKVMLHAKNALGSTDSEMKIVVGDTIGLTPALGWNSWNCFGPQVTAENVKSAADAMVASGLINHGWTYINVDDYWEFNQRLSQNDPNFQGFEARNPDGTINSNKRFPSMKAMADYIHSKGLRAGLYSGPGPTTCGGCTASYQHEDQDAKSWADWGFDYIKYDLCSYGNQNIQQAERERIVASGRPQPTALDMAKEPYRVLSESLKKVDRDILYSFCQYGGNNVWEWAPEFNGNSWRTTGDITDTWGSLTGIWDSQTERGGRHVDLYKYASPGHFNDADMMIVGAVSVASGRSFHPTNLSPNEQYIHVTAWILMDCPMLIGCDMTKLDDFTLNLLCNDEVLAVNQDPLGKAAARIIDKVQGGGFEVWAKDMADGSKAVGIFNRSELEGKYTLTLADVGINGPQTVRDLWRQKDVGPANGTLETSVPRHGVMLFKIAPAK